jgi:hypothetical protein
MYVGRGVISGGAFSLLDTLSFIILSHAKCAVHTQKGLVIM